MYSHQANFQLHNYLFNSPHHFNPTPTFLGVTFDRTLFYSKYVSLLKAKFYLCLKAERRICTSSSGPFKEFLSFLYKAFLRPFLTYASPGWSPFLSATNITKLERLHRAAGRAVSGSLSFFPIPLLVSKASLPPLGVTLTHFALSSYGPSSSNLSHFRHGQTWSETKTAHRPGELLSPLTRS